MERGFARFYKGVDPTRLELNNLRPLLVQQAERTGDVLFDGWAIYALDHTPFPRPHAPTVSDRGHVHGADGVVIGHQYSLLGRVMHRTGSWVGVVDGERIATRETPTEVGAEQIMRLKVQTTLPLIITADSEYVTDAILDTADARTRLLVRFKGNRKLYGTPPPTVPSRRGRRPTHGAKLKLNQAETFRAADYSFRVEETDGSSTVIAVWKAVHVTSRPALPLCAVRVEIFCANGERRYKRPLWLAWTGPAEIDWVRWWRVYLKRFCLECVHQFTKNSLSWTRARFGYTGREERWTWLVLLAYWQLLLAAPVARDLCRGWEKPTPAGKLPSPGRVQRDGWRIFREVESPARPPKARGIGLGRPRGYRPSPRPRFRVVHKSEKRVVAPY